MKHEDNIKILEKYKEHIEKIHHGGVDVMFDNDGLIKMVSGNWNEIVDKPIPENKSMKYDNLWQIVNWLKLQKEEIKNCMIKFIIRDWSLKYISKEYRENL